MPIGEADASAPVEFAPPDGHAARPDRHPDRRAGERARRHGHARRPRRPRVPVDPGDPEGRMVRQARLAADPPREARRRPARVRAPISWTGLFRDGDEVTVSELRNGSPSDCKEVQEPLYADAVKRGWFRSDPTRSAAAGTRSACWPDPRAGVAFAFVLAAFTHWGLLGIPLILGGIGCWPRVDGCPRAPRRARRCSGACEGSDGHRDRGDPHVAVGREGERVHTVPAVRRGVRAHREVGEGVRGSSGSSRTRAGTSGRTPFTSRSSPTRSTGSRSRPAARSPRPRRARARAGSAAAGSPAAAAAGAAAAPGEPRP